MYVDASALVAILMNEPERGSMLERISSAAAPVTSMVSFYEAMAAIGRYTSERSGAAVIVEQFLESANIEIVDIGLELLDDLENAYRLYGKGSGHPAQLNMSDCFSYAAAKSRGVPLLYKGNDFAQTDLA